jgi:hypothetical protein
MSGRTSAQSSSARSGRTELSLLRAEEVEFAPTGANIQPWHVYVLAELLTKGEQHCQGGTVTGCQS